MEIFEKIQEDAHTLGVDLPSGELAALMQENNASAESIRIVSKVFGHLREKKWDATVSMYHKPAVCHGRIREPLITSILTVLRVTMLWNLKISRRFRCFTHTETLPL